MDSKPVRVVFLTEREDEATQCRVQGYRFAHGNAVNINVKDKLSRSSNISELNVC